MSRPQQECIELVSYALHHIPTCRRVQVKGKFDACFVQGLRLHRSYIARREC